MQINGQDRAQSEYALDISTLGDLLDEVLGPGAPDF